MAECEVCCEVFDEGLQCPKILPCIHTLCVRCLRRLEKYGEIQCPFDRIVHAIPIGGVRKFPTNQQALKQTLAEKNKISSSLGGTPPAESRTESCKLHGKPLIIDDEIDGKFCETCLTIASSVVSQRKSISEEHFGQRSNYQESVRECVQNSTSNSAASSENESGQRSNYQESARECVQNSTRNSAENEPGQQSNYQESARECVQNSTRNSAENEPGQRSNYQESARESVQNSTRNSAENESGQRSNYQESARESVQNSTRNSAENESGQRSNYQESARECVRNSTRNSAENESGQRSNYQESARECVQNSTRNSAENEPGLCGDFSRLDIGQEPRICNRHGETSICVIYNVVDGTEKRFCETCLNQDSSGSSDRSGSSDQHSQRLRNNASTRNSTRGRRNEVGVFGTVSRLNTGLPIYQQSNFAANAENVAGSCALHGKPLIIYNETDGRFCETCLNLDASVMAERESGQSGQTGPAASRDQHSQSSRNNAVARNSTTGGESEGARCPLHRKPLIRITYNLIDGTVQRLCETCLNTESSISSQQESRSRTRTEQDSRICALHAKPLIIYNETDGRFCETCLNLDSFVLSQRESSNQQPQPSQDSSSNNPQVCAIHGTQSTHYVIRGKSFCGKCSNVDFDKIFASRFNFPQRLINRGEICEQHGQPFTQYTYYVGYGEHRRFCKACFNPDSLTTALQMWKLRQGSD